MFKNNFFHRCGMAGVLAITLCLFSSPAQADEPQIVTVALFLDFTSTLDILVDGKVIVFGAGPANGNSTTKSTDSGFPAPFASQNLVRRQALTVTQGHVYSGIVWSLSNFPVPYNGAMVLNGDVTIDYIGFVTDNSNTIEEDELGESLMIILTGEVH